MGETTRLVLVVEDDCDTAELLSLLLRRTGIEVECVSNTADARQAIGRARPCCIVLDQMMPDGTGLELFREMRADPELSDIPTLFYSAGLADASGGRRNSSAPKRGSSRACRA